MTIEHCSAREASGSGPIENDAVQDGRFWIHPDWREAFGRSGLDSFDRMMAFSGGHVFSEHWNRDARRVTLDDGRVVYIKREIAVEWSAIANDLLHLRRSQPMTHRERIAIERVAALGIQAPRIVGHGQRRVLGMARQGFLVLLPVQGQPLDEFYKSNPSESERFAALRATCEVMGRIDQAGLYWPDLRAKHVFVDRDGSVSLIDLERLVSQNVRNRRQIVHRWRVFLKELRAAGAGKEDFALLQTLVHAPAIKAACEQAGLLAPEAAKPADCAA